MVVGTAKGKRLATIERADYGEFSGERRTRVAKLNESLPVGGLLSPTTQNFHRCRVS